MNKTIALRIVILIFYFKHEIKEEEKYWEVETFNDVLIDGDNIRYYVPEVLKGVELLK